MADDLERRTLSEGAARQLANATKNNAQWGGITPRWLPSLESSEGAGRRAIEVECSPPRDSNPDLPETFVDYVDNPREYFLKAVTTVLDVQTRVSERRRRTRPERGICRALLQRQRASRPAPRARYRPGLHRWTLCAAGLRRGLDPQRFSDPEGKGSWRPADLAR